MLLSLWEPNCLPLLLCNTALTKYGDVPVTGAALNLFSVGYMFRSVSKTGYLNYKFFIVFVSIPVQTTRQNTSQYFLSHPSQLSRHELYHSTLNIRVHTYAHEKRRSTKNNSPPPIYSTLLCSMNSSLVKLRNNDSIKITSIWKRWNTSLNYGHHKAQVWAEYLTKVTRLWTGKPKNWVPIPGRCGIFSLRHYV